jgi:uncharacterized membrane protein YbaN (DUF454 family)
MGSAKTAVGAAVALLVLALVLGIVGLVMDALRWLLILAAIVLLARRRDRLDVALRDRSGT